MKEENRVQFSNTYELLMQNGHFVDDVLHTLCSSERNYYIKIQEYFPIMQILQKIRGFFANILAIVFLSYSVCTKLKIGRKKEAWTLR